MALNVRKIVVTAKREANNGVVPLTCHLKFEKTLPKNTYQTELIP